jgi:anaerobic magnesium-protoporphyrin IX monomethyl ester cyclase
MTINNKLKLLLVNPPAPQIIEPHYDRPDFPRTALAFLAGHVRDRCKSDIEIHVMDCKFDRLNEKEAATRILKINPDIIGFTAMTNEIKSAARLCSILKEHCQFTSIVGGVHYTALPEETLFEFPCFDFGVAGEGEEVLCDLLMAIKNNLSLNIPGVGSVVNNKFIGSKDAQKILDQNTINPAWDMFRPAKEYLIQSSRGCPFACEFCMNPGGRVVRPRSIETTIKELKWLVENMKPESIYFGDEIFTVNQKRAELICDEIIKEKLHHSFSWRCQTHVSTLNENLVQKMKLSNCRLVGLGIETGNDLTFKSMGKGTSRKKVKSAIELLNRYNLDYSTFFILGQANETFSSAKDTVNFAIELNPMEPVFGLMVPYPGTIVWEMAKNNRNGFKLLSTDWDAYNKQIGDALALDGITRPQLERLQFFGYVKVFLYNYRFLDFIKFCFKYRTTGMSLVLKQFMYLVRR